MTIGTRFTTEAWKTNTAKTVKRERNRCLRFLSLPSQIAIKRKHHVPANCVSLALQQIVRFADPLKARVPVQQIKTLQTKRSSAYRINNLLPIFEKKSSPLKTNRWSSITSPLALKIRF